MNRDPFEIVLEHMQSAPVDLAGMARGLGLVVSSDPSLPQDVSGYIKRDKQGYFIGVNPKHALVRQRFTVAHEIAHYLLHRDQIGDGVLDDALYRSSLSSALEAEANKWAAAILMPPQLIERLRAETPGINNSELASRLQVSTQALSIRLGIPVEA